MSEVRAKGEARRPLSHVKARKMKPPTLHTHGHLFETAQTTVLILILPRLLYWSLRSDLQNINLNIVWFWCAIG